MEDIKLTIAKNIAALRTKAGMTQAELAEKLNYSDKAVSKWERGESMPDITVLASIASTLGVKLEQLLKDGEETPEPGVEETEHHTDRGHNRRFITALSVILVWFLATVTFVVVHSVAGSTPNHHWLIFVYGLPLSLTVWLVLNSLWFDVKRNYFIISLLMWSLIAAVYLTLLVGGYNIWLLFAIGIPGQVLIILWSRLRFRKRV